MLNIKLDKADQYFSLYIRELADWKCARCNNQYERNSKGIHCSHFYGRRNESTRFEPMNADAHCFFCHQYLGSNPAEFRDWKFQQLGEKKYKLLQILKNSYKKKDRKLELIIWKAAYEKLCKKKGIEPKKVK